MLKKNLGDSKKSQKKNKFIKAIFKNYKKLLITRLLNSIPQQGRENNVFLRNAL